MLGHAAFKFAAGARGSTGPRPHGTEVNRTQLLSAHSINSDAASEKKASGPPGRHLMMARCSESAAGDAALQVQVSLSSSFPAGLRLQCCASR